MSKLFITDTILRDAHQSQAATRMRTEEMLPACEILDSMGYWSLECWGGATFDSCLRFLNEDPWERLRKLKKALPHTRLQMLFRGQNILGYKMTLLNNSAVRQLKTELMLFEFSMHSTTFVIWNPQLNSQKNTADTVNLH